MNAALANAADSARVSLLGGEKKMSRSFQFESLEKRSLFSASVATPAVAVHPDTTPTVTRYIIGFWGYAFGGTPGTGFGNQWTTNLVDTAGSEGAGTAKMFAEESGPANAESYLLKAIDTNHDGIIEASEVHAMRLRVVGYSLGGTVAVNFTRDLDEAGSKVDGYKLDVAIPVQELVTLDPVNYPITYPPLVHTDGPESNVDAFFNYYEDGSSDGVSTINLFDASSGASEGSYSEDDTALPVIGYLHGDSLDSDAVSTAQYDVDSAKYAHHPVTHLLQDGVDGELKGIQTDHGTLPFYAYPDALADLIA
jgi:hypothetical protein